MPPRFAQPRFRRFVPALICFLLIALVAASAASAAIRLGAYSAAPGQSSALADSRVLDDFTSMTGRKPDILHDYGNVTEPLFTPSEIENLEAHDTVPMMTWQLFQSGWSGPVITLPDIAAGRYDAELHEAAQLAKSLHFEILIRFAHEMNGDWYPWRPGGEAGNTGSNYVDAWRHIVSVFRTEGADNVKWVWSPNVDYGAYPFAQYFPGDEWVDYVALDGYNWGTGGVGYNKWQSLSEVFASSYAQLTSLSSKPVMIAETSSSENGGDKAAWIRQGFLRTIPEKLPRVAAVLWFDRDMEQDWRVNSSQASLDAYREVASSKIYGGPRDVPLPPLDEKAPATTKKGKGKKTLRSLRVTQRVTLGSAGDSRATSSAVRERRAGPVSVRGQIVYRLAHRARVRIAIERRAGDGRFSPRLTRVRGSRAGRNQILFRQLGSGLHLHPGAYRVSLIALDGAEGPPRKAHFRVLG